MRQELDTGRDREGTFSGAQPTGGVVRVEDRLDPTNGQGVRHEPRRGARFAIAEEARKGDAGGQKRGNSRECRLNAEERPYV